MDQQNEVPTDFLSVTTQRFLLASHTSKLASGISSKDTPPPPLPPTCTDKRKKACERDSACVFCTGAKAGCQALGFCDPDEEPDAAKTRVVGAIVKMKVADDDASDCAAKSVSKIVLLLSFFALMSYQ